MFAFHLLYAGILAAISYVSMVANTGLSVFQAVDLAGVPAFTFMRSLFVEITRPVQQANVDILESDYMSSIPTSPVTVTDLILRPPSLVPSVIVKTTTDLAIIPTTCKALLVLEAIKPVMARTEEDQQEPVCEWPSATPITLIEFSPAFAAPSLPPPASTSTSHPRPTARSPQSKTTCRSNISPALTIAVVCAVICASIPFLSTNFVLPRRCPDQQDHSSPCAASQHENISVREPKDGVIPTADIEENTPTPFSQPELISGSTSSEGVQEPLTTSETETAVSEIEVAHVQTVVEDSIQTPLSHNEAERTEVSEIKLIDEQTVANEEVEEILMDNVPVVEALEVGTTALTEQAEEIEEPSSVNSAPLVNTPIANDLVDQIIVPPVPTAPESEVEPEIAPSTRPKRRRGKRGGVRSETTRRRKNAERAELRAYDFNVDEEEED
ncbi:hypothetical protein EIP91_006976 [Steccherinum ochraceum]|uniref:Uncharacterized protein n=1 Tax=Steccherinum ochraceum TaxID=92696 RepID=A0A4V2MVG7_9APHY|nr:hypothetical protein EIP91_006976 [Steccherinum ochraceum]